MSAKFRTLQLLILTISFAWRLLFGLSCYPPSVTTFFAWGKGELFLAVVEAFLAGNYHRRGLFASPMIIT